METTHNRARPTPDAVSNHLTKTPLVLRQAQHERGHITSVRHSAHPEPVEGRAECRFDRAARRGAAAVRRWATAVGPLAAAMALALLPSAAMAAEPGAAVTVSDPVKMWGFVAAALSTGITALGAAYAVSHVGAAALGTMGERPEIAGRALIFLGLAEGIAIYGLIIAIMILGRLG